MTHELKILKPFADAVASGKKTFEVRRNDRGFTTGDKIRFHVISAETGEPIEHPLNGKAYEVGYILRFEDFPAGLSEGFAVFTIKPEQIERKEAET